MNEPSGRTSRRPSSILLGVALGAAVIASPAYPRLSTPTGDFSEMALGVDCSTQPDGTACDDGSACTLGEICLGGACLPPVSFAQAAGSPVAAGANARSIAAADVNGDGKLDLAVANYGAGNVSILLGNGSGGFSQAAGSPVTVGSAPASIGAGDLNGDGRADLAVANAFSHNVTILLGNGAGGFTEAAGSPIAAGLLPFSVAVGYLNGDNRPDLAVAGLASNNVTVLLGNGSGGFSSAAGSPVGVGTQPNSVAIGDLNGDGKTDLATANTGSNNVTILLGNGSGGFSQAAGSPVPVGTSPEEVAVRDLDGDGKLDLAVANAGSNDVTVLLGNGAGGFSQAVGSPVAVGTTPGSVVVMDLNGDGRVDLATANRSSEDVTLLLGKGAGGFSQAVGSPLATGPGTSPIPVASGDVNGDGRLDLAVANFGSGSVTVFVNGTTFAADGTACEGVGACNLTETCRSGRCVAPVSFGAAAGSPIAVAGYPISEAAGDWNGDGKLDLALGHIGGTDKIAILLGDGAGGFSPAAGSPITVGVDPQHVAAGDLNGDGRLDLVVSISSTQQVVILLGNGAGGFSPAAGSPYAAGGNPYMTAIADLDRDGRPDLAIANDISNNVTILLGNGAGGFTQAAGSPIAAGLSPISLAVADADGDGRLDLAVANYGSNNLTILLGNGSGGFSQAPGSPIATGAGPFGLTSLDANGDDRVDLAVANTASNNVMILLGNGSGGFSQALGSPVGVGTSPRSIATGDLNGDGALDLAVTNTVTDDVTILLGNGAGRFAAAGPPVAAGDYPAPVVAADLNRDGKVDLAVANLLSGNVTILLGQTCRSGQCLAPAFTQPSGSPVAAGFAALGGNAAGDLNRDGRPDLAVTNYVGQDVTILLGNGLGGFSQASAPAVGSYPTAVVTGDLNGDGKLDLAVANRSVSGSVTILLGNGAGGFTQAAGSPVATGSGPATVAIGDLNGDGKLDLATSDEFSDVVTILLGDGAGGFTQAAGSPIAVESRPRWVAIDDLNGDGKLDLAVGNLNSTSVSILLGNGAGGFTQAAGSPITVSGTPYAVAIADLNRDGKLDLALAHFSAVSILLGNGAGGFSHAAASPFGVGAVTPVSVTIGDLDGDGKLDLAVAGVNSDNVAMLLGNGSGGFSHAPGSPVAVAPTPSGVAFTDLNADGRLDLAVVGQSHSVTILLNQTIVAPIGTSCDDGNVCSTNDVCAEGFCNGTPVPPPADVDDGVRVNRSGGSAVVSWNLAAGASTSAVLRGLVSALPVGPGGGDESCLAGSLSSTTLQWTDAASPATGVCFWYLIRGDNACGEGPYGFRAQNGTPTAPRLSTTCP